MLWLLDEEDKQEIRFFIARILAASVILPNTRVVARDIRGTNSRSDFPRDTSEVFRMHGIFHKGIHLLG